MTIKIDDKNPAKCEKQMYRELVTMMKELGYNEHMIRLVKGRITELQNNGVQGINKFIKKLKDRVNNKEDYLDILMEGRFAVILARNHFSKIYIEYYERGSDLKADWNRKSVFFEVTRKRANSNEWSEHPEAQVISPVPDENVIRKIEEKLRQLKHGEINLVVFWSDTIELGSNEIRDVFTKLNNKIERSPKAYKDLSGVLFTEGGGVDTATLRQFYLYKNNIALNPIDTRLGNKLESLFEGDKKKFQRDLKEIGTALRRFISY